MALAVMARSKPREEGVVPPLFFCIGFHFHKKILLGYCQMGPHAVMLCRTAMPIYGSKSEEKKNEQEMLLSILLWEKTEIRDAPKTIRSGQRQAPITVCPCSALPLFTPWASGEPGLDQAGTGEADLRCGKSWQCLGQRSWLQSRDDADYTQPKPRRRRRRRHTALESNPFLP